MIEEEILITNYSYILMKKGFTLIELLVVIGILAIIATVAVLVLNPAQLFAQARDSQRITDLSTLRDAMNLYLSTVTSSDLDGGTSSCSTLCYTGTSGIGANCDSRHSGKTTTIDTDRNVDGTGWIPVSFASTSGGAPLATLPIDPVSDTTYFYSYACDNSAKTFELNANMESTRYAASGDDDVESTDGGNASSTYEIGSDPGLDI